MTMNDRLHKPYFTVALVFAVLFLGTLVIRSGFAWTNPTQLPPFGTPSISVSGGNVGIGISSPSNLFTVNQPVNANVTSYTTYGIGLYNQGTINATLGADATYAYLQSWASKPLQINNQGNNTIINSGSGNVGIGTANPTQKLDVNGYVKGTGLCIGADCRISWPAVTCPCGACWSTIAPNCAFVSLCTPSGWVATGLNTCDTGGV